MEPLPRLLASLSLDLCDPCSSPDATQEHPGVQPHSQQPERALGPGLRQGPAVPRGLFLPDRSQTPGVGEFRPKTTTKPNVFEFKLSFVSAVGVR